MTETLTTTPLISTPTSETGSTQSAEAISTQFSTLSAEGNTQASSLLTTILSLTTGTGSSTSTKQCAEMQAVDEAISQKITTTPGELPKGENIEFQVTSTRGVSFPENNTKPTIVVEFGKPADVQSVTIPRDKTPNANVERFEVTFYTPDGNKVNDKPIVSNSSPQDDKTRPARLDSSETPDVPVTRVVITILETTDKKSPKGIVLDIQACTEITTGK